MRLEKSGKMCYAVFIGVMSMIQPFAPMQHTAEKSTDELANEIMKSDNIADFLEKNGEHLKKISLSDELCRLLNEKGLKKSDVIASSGITITYGYDLFSGYRKKKPSRNVILSLALAMGLDTTQTQRLLKISENGALYPRVPRDSVIMYAVSRSMTPSETDELLDKNGMETLS